MDPGASTRVAGGAALPLRHRDAYRACVVGGKGSEGGQYVHADAVVDPDVMLGAAPSSPPAALAAAGASQVPLTGTSTGTLSVNIPRPRRPGRSPHGNARRGQSSQTVRDDGRERCQSGSITATIQGRLLIRVSCQSGEVCHTAQARGGRRRLRPARKTSALLRYCDAPEALRRPPAQARTWGVAACGGGSAIETASDTASE